MAQMHLKIIKKSGDAASLKKITKLFEELENISFRRI